MDMAITFVFLKIFQMILVLNQDWKPMSKPDGWKGERNDSLKKETGS